MRQPAVLVHLLLFAGNLPTPMTNIPYNNVATYRRILELGAPAGAKHCKKEFGSISFSYLYVHVHVLISRCCRCHPTAKVSTGTCMPFGDNFFTYFRLCTLPRGIMYLTGSRKPRTSDDLAELSPVIRIATFASPALFDHLRISGCHSLGTSPGNLRLHARRRHRTCVAS